MNAGIAPGVTNLVAADLLVSHPEADEVEMVFTVSSKGTSGRAGGDFAHRGMTALAQHHTTVVPLPAPFGPRRCLGFAEPDGGWLGAIAAGITVSPYICLDEASGPTRAAGGQPRRDHEPPAAQPCCAPPRRSRTR